MSTKLTLTIEKSVIEKAKKYARSKDKSLSYVIENYLKALTGEDSANVVESAPTVTALKGAFKIPKDFDYKKELSDRLSEKYLS